ncbi:MAG TPA: hypothetical protein VFU99_04825 [Gaiellaceae bacterium]|nr:hypothetical protein [Gaiellaceae bacterium]
MSVATLTRNGSFSLDEARATFTLAIIAGLVWGVLLPVQIAGALGG